MPKNLNEFSLEEIYALLPDYIKSSSSFHNLKILPESNDHHGAKPRKRHFHLEADESIGIHLSLGLNMEKTFQKSQQLFGINPEVTCKPLFVSGSDDIKLFGQEFFDGQPIDVLYNNKKLKEYDVDSIIRKIKNLFSSIEKESSRKLMLLELEGFFSCILENKFLCQTDIFLLRNEVFPVLREEFKRQEKFSIRWSPGDLVARNILVNTENKFKVVDFEFAYKTHFHLEDFIRLSEFSCKPFTQLTCLKILKAGTPPVFRIYHYLRQTILVLKIFDQDNYNHYIQKELTRIIRDLVLISNSKCQSIKGLSNNISQLENEIIIQKKMLIDQKLDLSEKDDDLIKKKVDLENTRADLNRKKVDLENTRADLNRKKVDLENSKAELNEKNVSLSEKKAEILKRNIEIVKTKKSLLMFQEKNQRLQKSFSWKITFPLRFLRRVFVDPVKLHRQKNIIKRPVSGSYEDWINKYDNVGLEMHSKFEENNKDLVIKPLFSIIMPVYDPPIEFLEAAINSVTEQVYENWELCINDDNSNNPQVQKVLNKYMFSDPRIKVSYSSENEHISASSNQCLKLAVGEYVVLMDHDDLMRPHSLLRLAQVWNKNHDAQIIYTDEDKIDENGKRSCPYFKPDWNPDLILAQNFVCHLFCANRKLVEKVGGFRMGFEGSQDWDLVLRLIEKIRPEQIYHIPQILYHWRIHSKSVANNISNKSYAVKAGQRAVQDHLDRIRHKAKAEVVHKQFIRINRLKSVESSSKASIIIPTKNNHNMLRKCINSILELTPPDIFELLIVDNQTDDNDTIKYYEEIKNGKNVKIINFDAPFNFSSINNYTSNFSKGNILVFLNDDTEVLSKNWLQELISDAQRPDVGAVGAKLLYPDNTYQHAGIVLGYCLVAGEMMKGLPSNHPGQMQRANLKHNVSAVTGACLGVEKKKFDEVGGFDEVNLKVAFNDVDLCLRLLKSGYRTLYNPNVVLHHYESYSRGADDTPAKKLRFESEINYMLAKWSKIIDNDPCYNPNLSLEWQKQFQLAFPPRN